MSLFFSPGSAKGAAAEEISKQSRAFTDGSPEQGLPSRHLLQHRLRSRLADLSLQVSRVALDPHQLPSGIAHLIEHRLVLVRR